LVYIAKIPRGGDQNISAFLFKPQGSKKLKSENVDFFEKIAFLLKILFWRVYPPRNYRGYYYHIPPPVPMCGTEKKLNTVAIFFENFGSIAAQICLPNFHVTKV
jgi:hypothetical protein